MAKESNNNMSASAELAFDLEAAEVMLDQLAAEEAAKQEVAQAPKPHHNNAPKGRFMPTGGIKLDLGGLFDGIEQAKDNFYMAGKILAEAKDEKSSIEARIKSLGFELDKANSSMRHANKIVLEKLQAESEMKSVASVMAKKYGITPEQAWEAIENKNAQVITDFLLAKADAEEALAKSMQSCTGLEVRIAEAKLELADVIMAIGECEAHLIECEEELDRARGQYFVQ